MRNEPSILHYSSGFPMVIGLHHVEDHKTIKVANALEWMFFKRADGHKVRGVGVTHGYLAFETDRAGLDGGRLQQPLAAYDQSPALPTRPDMYIITSIAVHRTRKFFCLSRNWARPVVPIARSSFRFTKSRLRRRLFDLQQRQVCFSHVPAACVSSLCSTLESVLSDDPRSFPRPRRKRRSRRYRSDESGKHASSSADS